MNTSQFSVHGLDHVQIAMPAGQEAKAREFYSEVLGLIEVPVPASLANRGVIWFERESLRVHLGIDADFHPAKKAHPAFLVKQLDLLAGHLQRAGIAIVAATPIQGRKRFHIFDPFGNRIELLELLSS